MPLGAGFPFRIGSCRGIPLRFPPNFGKKDGMVLTTVAILSPGDMGEGVGASIKGQGIDVITVLAGRSDETRMRAERAGFREVADLEELVAEADLVLSIIPERAEATAADGRCDETCLRNPAIC